MVLRDRLRLDGPAPQREIRGLSTILSPCKKMTRPTKLSLNVWSLAISVLVATSLSEAAYGQDKVFTAADLVEIIPDRGGRGYSAPYLKWSADADIDLYVVHDAADSTCVSDAIDEIQRSATAIRREVQGLARLGVVRPVTQVPQATDNPAIIITLPTEAKSIKADLDRYAKAHSPNGVRFERGGNVHVYHGMRSTRQAGVTTYDFDIATTVVATGRVFALGYSWTINEGAILWSGASCVDEEWSAPLYASLGAINLNAAAAVVGLRRSGINLGPREYSKVRLSFLKVLYGQSSAVVDPNALRTLFADIFNDPTARARLD